MNKNAIVVFGGGLVRDRGGWRTVDFGDSLKPDKAGGSRLRVLAGYFLYKKNRCLIISSGGKNKFYQSIGAPDISSVMKKELICLGVKPKDIIESPKPKNTYQEIQALKNIIKKNGIGAIYAVSSRYHLPRIKALAEYDSRKPKLADLARMHYLSAENIVIRHDAGKWTDSIEKAYAGQAMKEKIKLERRGIEEIKAGTYKFK